MIRRIGRPSETRAGPAPMTTVPSSPVDTEDRALGRSTIGRRRTFYERQIKRPLDVVVSAGLLVLLAPLLAVVAVAVRVRLGHPVIYRQTRLTRGGEEFEILKFRTMLPDRRAADVAFVGEDRRRDEGAPDDPRHTPLGRRLRRLGLDELPQLVNVLRGEMSLVGPRPERPHIAARHDLVDHPRHSVRSGITGPWQISPQRPGRVHEHVDLDLSYVERVSFTADARIAARTVRVIARAIGP